MLPNYSHVRNYFYFYNRTSSRILLFSDENTSQRTESLRQRLFALPHEPDYNLVKNSKRQVTDERRAYLCAELEAILISMSYAAGKMFRDVAELPCIDNVCVLVQLPKNKEIFQCFHGLRVEDVAPKKFADAFYRKYPKREGRCDLLQEWVMEPVVEVSEKQTNSNELSDDVLVPTPLPLPEKSSQSVVNVNKGKIELPRDHSLGSLLQWFTLAEEANKIKK